MEMCVWCSAAHVNTIVKQTTVAAAVIKLKLLQSQNKFHSDEFPSETFFMFFFVEWQRESETET